MDRVQDFIKKYLQRRIEKELGGSLHIIPDHKGKPHIYPDSLTVQELVRENQSLKQKLKTLLFMMPRSSKQLRADIKTKATDVNQSLRPVIVSKLISFQIHSAFYAPCSQGLMSLKALTV